MNPESRRTFLRTAAAGMLAQSAFPVLGANDRINLGVIGIGGRGRDHIDEFAKQPQCRITAVCDVDQAGRERGVAQVDKLLGYKPKQYTDMRKLFDDKEIDAVSIATPNHWHALGTIWACQAGKDVYVEKPPATTSSKAARWSRRRGSTTAWCRSARKAAASLTYGAPSNLLGTGRHRQGLHGPRAVLQPPHVDRPHARSARAARRQLGHVPRPGAHAPVHRNRFHYNWHWFWDTGNGDIGNQGIHEMDKARWGLNRGLPKHVSLDRRQVRLQRRPGDAQHPARHLRLRR